jgi:hypothetical protein
MSEKIENSIPKPCQENWLEMNPDEKIRFCKLCQQNVFDVIDENKYDGDICLRYSTTMSSMKGKEKLNLLNKISKFLIKRN